METQEKHARRRNRLLGLIALELMVCAGALSILALGTLWGISTLYDRAPDIEKALDGLAAVSDTLGVLDAAGVSETLTSAALEAKESLTQAGEALSALDLEGLDEAVETLTEVISPLSELVEKLR